MAETRKSDFTGDVYGAWQVTGRAPAKNKKRAWHVLNVETREERVVLQTDLPALGAAGVSSQELTAAAIGGVVAPPAFEAMVNEAFVELTETHLWSHAGDLDIPDEQDAPTEVEILDTPIEGAEEFVADWVAPRATAGPGECQHGIDIRTCSEHWEMLGERSKEAHEKYPQKYDPTLAPAGRIAAAVIAANSIAGDPWEPYVGPEIAEWIDNLEDAPLIVPGESVEDDVTEAALDAAVPPQDELRKSIRVLMGLVHDHKVALQTLVAEVQVRTDDIAVLMDAVDAVMKEAVKR